MARDFATHLYGSKKWERLRERYFRKPVYMADGSVCPPLMCERCFARGKLVPAEICHHIIWVDETNIDDPSVTLNEDNLMRVCRDCHAEIHYPNKRRLSRSVTFGPNGEVLSCD
jgi:hypothetical protein